MNAEIIYEKNYPRTDHNKLLKSSDSKMPDNAEIFNLTFEEFMEKIGRDTAYILIPERLEASEKFIREAIDLSKFYEIDAKITRHIDHISADFFFDCGGSMRYINRLFGMADQFTFFQNINERDITVCLDYYTHTVVRKGRVIAP